jgi:hypothetical protein
MKIIFSLFFLSIAFWGCAPELQLLKGNYEEKPFEIYTDKSVDEVWNNIIELFSTKGISIKLIDKSSGLIVSEKTSFTNSYTIEDNQGKPKNPSAYVVCDKVVWQTVTYEPVYVTGEWNIRVVSKNNKTLINVNLLNIQCEYGMGKGIIGSGKSTRVFENVIADNIK